MAEGAHQAISPGPTCSAEWEGGSSADFWDSFLNCHHFSSSCEKIGIFKILKPWEFLPNSHTK